MVIGRNFSLSIPCVLQSSTAMFIPWLVSACCLHHRLAGEKVGLVEKVGLDLFTGKAMVPSKSLRQA
jgi:hypothetical protein